MIKNYLKIARRNIKKYKGYSFIKVARANPVEALRYE